MAFVYDNQPSSTSPISSDEDDSVHATPATKITAFSPNDGRESFKIKGNGTGSTSGSIVRTKVPPSFTLTLAHSNFNIKDQDKASTDESPNTRDPFVSTTGLGASTRTSTRASTESKLSPIASSFTPLSSSFGSFTSYNGGSTHLNGTELDSQSVGHDLATSMLAAVSTNPNGMKNAHRHEIQESSSFNSSDQSSLSEALGKLEVSSMSTPRCQFSTTDGTSRSIMVFDINPTIHARQVFCHFDVS